MLDFVNIRMTRKEANDIVNFLEMVKDSPEAEKGSTFSKCLEIGIKQIMSSDLPSRLKTILIFQLTCEIIKSEEFILAFKTDN